MSLSNTNVLKMHIDTCIKVGDCNTKKNDDINMKYDN